MTLLVSVVFTACGGGLTDAERVWCSLENRFDIVRAAVRLDLDLERIDSPARGEAPTSEFVRACKAAYELR